MNILNHSERILNAFNDKGWTLHLIVNTEGRPLVQRGPGRELVIPGHYRILPVPQCIGDVQELYTHINETNTTPPYLQTEHGTRHIIGLDLMPNGVYFWGDTPLRIRYNKLESVIREQFGPDRAGAVK